MNDYPISSLPPTLADLVAYESEALQCHASMVALPALVQLSAIIGSRAVVSPWSGWIEPCILWGCVVADSGSNKSRAMQSGLRYLVELQNECNIKYKQEVADYSESDRSYPRLEKHIVQDCTYESLLVSLCNNPSLLWMYDELHMWFDRLKTGTTNNIAGVLSLYDGRAQTVSRKTGDYKELIPPTRTSVNVLGSIQLDVLRKTLRTIGAFGNGLAYRFLYAVVESQTFDWHRLSVDAVRYCGVSDAYLLSCRTLNTAMSLLAQPLLLQYDQQSQHCLRDYLSRLESMRGVLDASTIGKARGQIVRLSAVLELMTNPTSVYVTQSSFVRACELWEWHNVSLQTLIDSVTTSWADGVTDRIYSYIQSASEAVSVRDVRNIFCAAQRPSVTQTIDILRKLAAQNQIILCEKTTIKGLTYIAGRVTNIAHG